NGRARPRELRVHTSESVGEPPEGRGYGLILRGEQITDPRKRDIVGGDLSAKLVGAGFQQFSKGKMGARHVLRRDTVGIIDDYRRLEGKPEHLVAPMGPVGQIGKIGAVI